MAKQIFISYRRDGGDITAGLICERLKNLGYSVFYDYDSLGRGCFDVRIYDAIAHCNDFILVLPTASLDRCVNEDDWVRKEIAHALKHQKNIIPVLLPGFEFPAHLPEDIAEVSRYNGVPFIMAYLDAVIESITDRLITEKSADAPSDEDSARSEARIAPLLKRVEIFLEDGEWQKADEYCEKILDLDPECAEAYLGKLMAERRVKTRAGLKGCALPFDDSPSYRKVMQFADASLCEDLKAAIKHIKARNESERITAQYSEALTAMETAKTEGEYLDAARLFSLLGEYKDAAVLHGTCIQKAAIAKEDAILAAKERKYAEATIVMKGAQNEFQYKIASSIFAQIPEYKDSALLSECCAEKAAQAKERLRLWKEELSLLEQKKKELEASPSGKTQIEVLTARRQRIHDIIKLSNEQKITFNPQELEVLQAFSSEKEAFEERLAQAARYDVYLDAHPILKEKEQVAKEKKALFDRLTQLKRKRGRAAIFLLIGGVAGIFLAVFIAILSVYMFLSYRVPLISILLATMSVLMILLVAILSISGIALGINFFVTRSKIKRAIEHLEGKEKEMASVPAFAEARETLPI